MSPLIQFCNCHEERELTHIHFVSHDCHEAVHIHHDNEEFHLSDYNNNYCSEVSKHKDFDINDSFAISSFINIHMNTKKEYNFKVKYLSDVSDSFRILKKNSEVELFLSNYPIQTKIINSTVLII